MRRLILALIMITSLVNPFLGAAINVALPQIGEEFSMGAIGMSWVAMAFLLSSAVFLVPLGKLADIRGRMKIFTWGNIVIAITSLLCALSGTGSQLIILRGIQGIGSAMVFGTGMAILTSIYPPGERGKAIGLAVTAVYVGLSLAPSLGGILTQYLGWRSVFWFTVPFQAIVVLLSLFRVRKDWADACGDEFDLSGSLVYMVSMSAFMFGFSRLPGTLALVICLAGLGGLSLFVILELRTRFPVFPIALFTTNRRFAFSNLAALINYATTFAITFLLSLYLQYIQGLSPRDAGLVLVIQPLIMALVATVAGKLSDRYDARILASSGMALTVIGLLILSTLSASSSLSLLVLALLIVGLGFGFFSSPNTHVIMSSVEKKHLGIASATVGTMRLTGQMISMGIATMILQLFVGNHPLNHSHGPDFLRSMQVTFLIFVILCTLGVFASLARGKAGRVIP